jgi:hypothetical protein
LIDAEAVWDGSYVPLDSFVINQWDEAAYKDAGYRRALAWYGGFFIDLFEVNAPNARTIDWIFHVRGKPIGNKLPSGNVPFSSEDPYSYLSLLGPWEEEGPFPCRRWDAGDGVSLSLYSPQSAKVLLLEGPDNPSTGKLSYLIQRVQGKKALFINVVSCGRNSQVVTAVSGGAGPDGQVNLRVSRSEGPEIVFSYKLD